MAYAPTLTVSLDASPTPRVEVLFSSFAAGTARVDVYRLAEGREFKVRSAVKAATAGALSRIDYEVPFGVLVTYRAEMFNAVGVSLGFTDTASAQVNAADTWIHNPLDPSGAVRVTMAQTAAAALSRPVQGEVFYPEGRRVGVVISGQRRGLEKVNLNCYTFTDEDTDKYAALVGTYTTSTVPVLCVRISAELRMRIPRTLFAVVFNPQERAFDLHNGGSTVIWEAEGTEVSPPSPAIIIPLLTNSDINNAHATNGILNSSFLSNLAINRAYELAGSA